eukprot:7086588-Prymnesium_polylepis.1
MTLPSERRSSRCGRAGEPSGGHRTTLSTAHPDCCQRLAEPLGPFGALTVDPGAATSTLTPRTSPATSTLESRARHRWPRRCRWSADAPYRHAANQ